MNELTRRSALILGAAGLAAPAMAAVSERVVGVTPLKMLGDRPWTPVWIEKQGPYPFGVATGHNYFSVRESLAEQLKLRPGPPTNLYVGLYYTLRPARGYLAQDVSVGGAFGLNRVGFGGLRADEEAAFAGLMPLLPDRITSFDFGAGAMRYLPDGTRDFPDHVEIPLIAVGASRLAWVPQVLCQLGGRDVRLRIRTERAEGVALTPDAVRRLGLWDTSAPSYQRTLDFGGGVRVAERVTRGGDLDLGSVRLPRPVVHLHDPGHAEADSGVDGWIGMGVLKRFDMVLDQPRRTMLLRPTARLSEAFGHDRAGFDLARDGEAWVVSQVDAASPAARAGLTVGDHLALKGDEVGDTMAAAREREAGANLKFGVIRDGVRQPMDITLEDRL